MEANTTNPKKQKKKSAKGVGTAIVIGLFVIALGLGGTILYLQYSQKQQQERYLDLTSSAAFRDGVTVNGVAIGGLSMEEAAAALKQAEADAVSELKFSLIAGDKTFTAAASDFSVSYNTQAVLEEAFQLARSASSLEELEALLADIADTGRSYTLEYTVDPASVNSYVQRISEEIDTDPVPASFTVKQLELNTDTNAAKALDLTVPSGADIRDYRFEFVEGKDGFGVNQQELASELNRRITARQFGSVEVPLASIHSDVTIASLKANLVLRSSASTSFARGHYSRASRVHNIKKAAGLMYGTTLQPGDQFSCNTILGDRTEKLGWQLAPAVIEAGAATEDQAGGGVCQVSTTVYNAVLKGDLQIVNRRAHSQKLSYVAGGLDATINTGTIDFIWANNTASPIYVFTWVNTEDKSVHCEIFGEPFTGGFDSIELRSEQMPNIEPTEPTYTVDPTLTAPYWRLKNDAQAGYVFDTYKQYLKDGKLVEEVLIGETKYNMHPARYLIWDGWIGELLLPEYQLDYVRAS